MEAENRIQDPPIFFAHRGGKADAPENTLSAFMLALSNKASGIESDARLTQCGNVVLNHDRHFGSIFRRRQIRKSDLTSLPAEILSLSGFFSKVKGDFHFSIDVKDSAATEKILEIARSYSFPLDKLWLCHPDIEKIAEWRSIDKEVRLVNSTTLDQVKEGPEKRLSVLKEVGADAFNMHFSEWNEGLVSLCHRFQIRSFAWDAQKEEQIIRLLSIGVDGIYSDYVRRMSNSWENYKNYKSKAF